MNSSYCVAQLAMDRADQEVQRQHVKKKTIAVEKRQVKEQKLQAEQHMALEADLQELKKVHFEWQAYHINKVVMFEKTLNAFYQYSVTNIRIH